MKVPLYNVSGQKSGEVELPAHFDSPVKFPLIRRAVISEQTEKLQPKGPYKFAGVETSAKYRGRKEDYGSLKNQGQAMLPREVFPKGRHGKVRRIPSSVKGRRAHPPKPEKILHERLNKKEHRAAIISALAATAQAPLAKKRGHLIPDGAILPLVVEDSFENFSRTKEANSALEKLVALDLSRAKDGGRRKTGTGSRSSRRKTYPKSALVVVSEKAHVQKSLRNIAGIDVCNAKTLSASALAPGCHPGRLAVFTKAALDEISKL